MRIRRSVTRFFTVLLVPAITVAVVSYFGAYAIWGDRGILRLEEAQSRLALQKQQLVQLQDSRARLEHRIGLMEQAGADPDLVEELARTELMTAAPNQVAVPRR
ncbi:MAG TPA: septum formation initiator family protein [Rhizomicrobium sp.]|jgi:cell division protein FtsB|nr:septum formation initiator family protein [Rhizomicrobium sp.]